VTAILIFQIFNRIHNEYIINPKRRTNPNEFWLINKRRPPRHKDMKSIDELSRSHMERNQKKLRRLVFIPFATLSHLGNLNIKRKRVNHTHKTGFMDEWLEVYTEAP
jgi:hypothetical protein